MGLSESSADAILQMQLRRLRPLKPDKIRLDTRIWLPRSTYYQDILGRPLQRVLGPDRVELNKLARS